MSIIIEMVDPGEAPEIPDLFTPMDYITDVPWWLYVGIIGGGIVLGVLLVRLATLRHARWFKILSSAMDEGVFVHENGKVLHFNETILRMTGYSREEFAKLNVLESLVHPDSKGNLRRSMALGDESAFFLRIVRKDRTSFPATARPRLFRSGLRSRRIVVLRDLSEQYAAEAAKAAGEARYRSLFDGTVEPLVFYRVGEVIDVNAAFVRMFDVPHERAIRMKGLDMFVSPADRDAVRRRIDGDSLEPYEARVVRRDGVAIDIEVVPSRIRSDAGDFRVASIRDITSRKRAEGKLARQVSLYQATLEAIDEAILVVDREGKVVSTNKRFTEFWDLSVELSNIVDDAPLVDYVARFQKNPVEFRRRVELLYANPMMESDDLLELLDGRVMERHSRPQLLYGEPVGRVWRFRDVTELDRGRRALGRQVALLDATLGATAEGVLVLDNNGRVELMNNRFYLLWGLPREEALPESGRDLFGALCRQVESADDFREEGEGWFFGAAEVTSRVIRLLNGRVLEVSVAPQFSDGRVVGRVCSFRDMTHDLMERDALRNFNAELELRVRERTAELERTNLTLRSSNAELEAFSSSVSHDLRSPLRGVDGLSLALSEEYADRLDETGRDYLRRIRGGVQRMGRIMDDLIHLSRVSRAELKHELVNLSAIGRSVVDTLRQDSHERTVIVDIAEGALAYGDKRLLRVVMENLLGNAWKYSSKKQAAVIVFGFEDLPSGARQFFVRDNGAGFDPAYKDKLFNTFNRLHGPQEFEGTGIGLALVGRIVKRHGGTVSADGEVGKGATFTFSMPSPPSS